MQASPLINATLAGSHHSLSTAPLSSAPCASANSWKALHRNTQYQHYWQMSVTEAPVSATGGRKSVNKWKNKLKTFLNTPLSPPAASSSSHSAASNNAFAAGEIDIPVIDAIDTSVHTTYSGPLLGIPNSDSYETRLSQLVGDLESTQYGSSVASAAIVPSHSQGVTSPSEFDDLFKYLDSQVTQTFASGSTSGSPLDVFGQSSTKPSTATSSSHQIERAAASTPDYLAYSGFHDLPLPALCFDDGTRTSATQSTLSLPSSSGAVSVALSAIESGSSDGTQQSKSAVSVSTIGTLHASGPHPYIDDVAASLSSQALNAAPSQQSLFLGDVKNSFKAPFNSPDDAATTSQADTTVTMPFSFADLSKYGIVEGGSMDIGGEMDDFSSLLMQAGISSSSTMPSSAFLGMVEGHDMSGGIAPHQTFIGHHGTSAPTPNSELTTGTSPTLSYGESSISNTSIDTEPLSRGGSHQASGAVHPLTIDTHNLIGGFPAPLKTPTHTPQHSLHLVSPSTPTSAISMSSNHSPYRRQPVIHASALAWRVAPTAMSPKSSITVAAREVPPSPTRLRKLSTISSPELKRRREEDALSPVIEETGSPSSFAAFDQTPRPMAGMRRVAGSKLRPTQYAQPPSQMQPAVAGPGPQSQQFSDRMIARSASHQQLQQVASFQPVQAQAEYQQRLQRSRSHQNLVSPSRMQQQYFSPSQPLPALPMDRQQLSMQGAWLPDDAVRGLYAQTAPNQFTCLLKNCHQTSQHENEMHLHIQNHISAARNPQFVSPISISPGQTLYA